MSRIRILIVDDHSLFREGLVSVLNAQADMEVIGEASDGLEAVVLARNLRPDMILMDVTMPGTDGIEATRLIKQETPNVCIIMLTVHDENEKLFEAIQQGAQGYLLKTIRTRQLVDMLHAAHQGEAALSPILAMRMLDEFRRLSVVTQGHLNETNNGIGPLSPRESEVLTFIARGLGDREISQKMNISLYTVKAHVRSVLQKLQVASRHEAARLAREKKDAKNM